MKKKKACCERLPRLVCVCVTEGVPAQSATQGSNPPPPTYLVNTPVQVWEAQHDTAELKDQFDSSVLPILYEAS